MILYIDTTDFEKATFTISGGKKVQKKSYKIDPHKNHETLGFLDRFLKSQNITPTQPPPLRGRRETPMMEKEFPSLEGRGQGRVIKKIIVNKGPGSYTGVRVGVTIAQALGFAWNIPVRAIAKERFVIRRKTLIRV